jgi:hypothetical protein
MVPGHLWASEMWKNTELEVDVDARYKSAYISPCQDKHGRHKHVAWKPTERYNLSADIWHMQAKPRIETKIRPTDEARGGHDTGKQHHGLAGW